MDKNMWSKNYMLEREKERENASKVKAIHKIANHI